MGRRTPEEREYHAAKEREYRRLRKEERQRLVGDIRWATAVLATRHGYTAARLLTEVFDITPRGGE